MPVSTIYICKNLFEKRTTNISYISLDAWFNALDKYSVNNAIIINMPAIEGGKKIEQDLNEDLNGDLNKGGNFKGGSILDAYIFKLEHYHITNRELKYYV